MKFLLIFLLSLFLVLLSGCGVSASSNSGGSTAPQKLITGIAVDGPISGANVGVDTNGNGVLDTSEVLTQTSAFGSYSIRVNEAMVGEILVSGGIDTTTNLSFQGQIKAPLPASSSGNIVVSPLTTLISEGMPEGTVKNLLGINLSTNVLYDNPIGNFQLERAASTIHAVAYQVATSGSSDINTVYKRLAQQSDFSEQSIQNVLNQVASGASSLQAASEAKNLFTELMAIASSDELAKRLTRIFPTTITKETVFSHALLAGKVFHEASKPFPLNITDGQYDVYAFLSDGTLYWSLYEKFQGYALVYKGFWQVMANGSVKIEIHIGYEINSEGLVVDTATPTAQNPQVTGTLISQTTNSLTYDHTSISGVGTVETGRTTIQLDTHCPSTQFPLFTPSGSLIRCVSQFP